MANQFNLDDRTTYDIGVPFLSVRCGNANISHTSKGIVVSLDSGTRYTCSYSKLFNLLKVHSINPNDVEARANINDVLSDFKKKCEDMLRESEKRTKELLTNK